MSDQAGILPKWFSNRGIILAKGQLDHSYTFWTMSILIFSPVQIIMEHPIVQIDISHINKDNQSLYDSKPQTPFAWSSALKRFSSALFCWLDFALHSQNPKTLLYLFILQPSLSTIFVPQPNVVFTQKCWWGHYGMK